MSYVVSIRRMEPAGITAEEFRSLAARDDSLHVADPHPEASESECCDVEWSPSSGGSPVLFAYYAGEVSVATPSHAALRKMQELARLLGAKVIGEEGEDLTEVEVPDWEISPVAGLSGCAVIVILLVATVWWLIAR
jgi:hypothetical protein